MHTIVSTSAAPLPAAPYSQAIFDGRLLHTSGIVGSRPDSGEVAADLRDEILQALANLRAVLEAGGGSLDTVVHTLCFLTDIANVSVFNEIYSATFGDSRPARSTVGVSLVPPYRFEIEAVATLVDGTDSK
jgi:2-iminobutanoate/2-iminopropanoate deaminase